MTQILLRTKNGPRYICSLDYTQRWVGGAKAGARRFVKAHFTMSPGRAMNLTPAQVREVAAWWEGELRYAKHGLLTIIENGTHQTLTSQVAKDAGTNQSGE